MKLTTVAWIIVALSSGCAVPKGSSSESVRDAIDGILDTPPLDQVHFGVLVVAGKTGRILYSRNPHQKFVPASNQKVLVTATALSVLGPDYRYETEVWATGSLIGSLLDGDLVVLASGDPSMSDRYWESGEASLAAIADSLYQKGLRGVAGSVFVDVSAWDSTTVGPTREVEDLRFPHGATGGAFAIDEGEISVIISAGPAVGSPASLEWSPKGLPDYVWDRVTPVPPDSGQHISPNYLPETRHLELT